MSRVKDSGFVLVIEVRDRYNNPVSGVDVSITETGPGEVTAVKPLTDERGQAVLDYDTVGAGNARVEATFDGGTGRQQANVTIHTAGQKSVKIFDPLGVEIRSRFSVRQYQSTTEPTGDGDGLSVRWERSTGEPIDGPVDLTAALSPAIEGSNRQYRLSNTTVGSVDPEGQTDAAGRHTTRFTPKNDGTTGVYVVSGSDFDVLTLVVTNTGSATGPTAAFDDGERPTQT